MFGSPQLGVSKNNGTPKWMVYNGKPYEQMDDLGVPLFLETPNWFEQPIFIQVILSNCGWSYTLSLRDT